MGSTVAAMALSAFGFGTGAPGSSAQASIAPKLRAATIQAYSISAGSMAAALNAFAAKNHLHLVYDSQVTEGLKTRGLAGAYSVREGLDHLLAGTALSYHLAENGRAVSIVLAQNDTGTQSDANGAVALPTVEVTANQGGTGCGPYGGAPCSGFGGAGPAQDPYNTSYVLPDASTGTKTDTPVMDTPLNVQSVSQQVLQDQQATTLQQALQNVSGVFVEDGAALNNNKADGIFSRGFQALTYYRDGFRVDASLSFLDFIGTRQLADIASVEVLKGPGAVLYGLVEPGGIVNIVTKEPLDVPYFAVQQQIGSLAFYRTTVDATGPLTDDKSVLYRMNMSYENNGAPFGSFIDLTHSQNIFLAPVIKWNIDGATWVKLEAEYNDNHSLLYVPLDPLFNGAFVNIPRSTNYGEFSSDPQKTLFSAFTWSHQFNSDWSIKQQIAYNRVDEAFLYADPFSIVDTVNGPEVERNFNSYLQDQTTYSSNVDITGHFNTFGAAHTLLLGGDIYRTTGDTLIFASDQSSFISLFNPIHPGTPFPLSCPCFTYANPFTQDTAGLYLQDQIKLPYNFYVLAGARYQYIHQTNASGESPDTVVPNGQPLTGQALTPRYGLLWRPLDWVSFYGNYEEGFGPNSGLLFPGTLIPPSNAESWEGGVKLEFFNGKLRATADYFDLTKTNIPTPDPLHPTFSLLTGAARSKGPELDIQGEILPGWSVIANYTNDDVRVTKGSQSSTIEGSLAVGQRFPGVPRNQANFWTTYEFQDETFKGLKIGAGYHYFGSQPIFDYSGSPPGTFALLPSYGTVDLMAAYSFKLYGANLTAQLNITNLFDTTYYTAAENYYSVVPGIGPGGSFRAYGAPFAALGSLRAQYPADASSPFSVPPPPPVPVFSWTGIYLGGQIGFVWGDNSGNVVFSTPGGGADALGSDAYGVIGGGHVGYNLQIDQWVIGVEGTIDGATLSRNVLVLAPDLADTTGTLMSTVTGTVRSGIQGSIRARAGYAFDRLLFYGTGGGAFAGFDTAIQLFGCNQLSAASGCGDNFYVSGTRSSTRTGWTAGGGVEYAINNNWSVRAEYRYSDFGHITDTPAFPAVGVTYTANRHLAQNQVQVGFSYKFAPPPPPVVSKY
ncbi:MAG TPA: TonB-dependent siderophore receptor [Methylocella sp.]|nr:TonB-dependent siderophore receptor [Methylocella sp.]